MNRNKNNLPKLVDFCQQTEATQYNLFANKIIWILAEILFRVPYLKKGSLMRSVCCPSDKIWLLRFLSRYQTKKMKTIQNRTHNRVRMMSYCTITASFQIKTGLELWMKHKSFFFSKVKFKGLRSKLAFLS